MKVSDVDADALFVMFVYQGNASRLCVGVQMEK